VGTIICSSGPSRSSGLSSNDESRLPNDYLLIFIQFGHNSQQFLFLSGHHSKSGDRSFTQKVRATV
jgi:hypothetical protein